MSKLHISSEPTGGGKRRCVMVETASGFRPVAFFEGPDANEHAALFAAAPDLLEASRLALTVLDAVADGRPIDVAEIAPRAATRLADAIARAEGGAA